MTKLLLTSWRLTNTSKFGVTGAGGVFISPGGKVDLKYSWGLGIKTNNEAEAFALLKGCHLMIERGFHLLNVFGDSTSIIKGLISSHGMKNGRLDSIMHKIKLAMGKIKRVKVYHIL